MFGGDIDGRSGRAAEPDRGCGCLNGQKIQLGFFNLQIAAVEIHCLAFKQLPVNGQKFRGMGIALIMGQKDTIACQLGRITAADNIDQKTSIADAVQCSRLAGHKSWECHAGPQGQQKAQPFGVAG